MICKAFTRLWEIAIAKTKVSDEGLKSLFGKKQINEIVMNHSEITSRGIEWLLENSEFCSLHVDDSQINDVLVEAISKKHGCDLSVEASADQQ